MYKALGFKLVLVVNFALILIIGIFAYININTQRNQLVEEVIREVGRLSDTIKRSTRYDMLGNRREELKEMIKTIGDQEGIEKVRIFNKEGKIMFSTAKEEMETLVDKRGEACYVCHAAEKPLEKLSTPTRSRIFKSKKGYRVLGMINPIYNEKDCYSANCHFHPQNQKVLGVLDVGISLADLDREVIANQWRITIFTVLAIFLTSAIIILFIRKLVTAPVSHLVAGTKRVAKGDYEHSISINSDDEIGELASSFNQMSSELKQRRQELDDWTKKLEQKVEERTKELKETQNQLIQSEKLASLGKLAAGVAHELNSPLTVILTFSDLLLKKNKDNPSLEKDLEIILGETTRCSSIVKGLLDFARKSEPKKEPSNINLIIEQTLSLVERQSLFHNIQIVKELNPNLPLIMVDANQMEQVLMNIILNAVEAMSNGGRLSITTARSLPDNFIEIRIEDTGSGIPEENLGRIFDPFFTTKESRRGTGLGLAVSYGIIQRHMGDIEVESKVGEGTKFIIKLPAEMVG